MSTENVLLYYELQFTSIIQQGVATKAWKVKIEQHSLQQKSHGLVNFVVLEQICGNVKINNTVMDPACNSVF